VDLRQQSLPEPSSSLELSTNYIPDLVLPPSVGSSKPSYALTNALPSDRPSLPLTAPSGLGLPVYSASGFDVLSILSRVVNRPNPTIQLGPVDLSCSFVIVDVRRYDCPIVYASPTFCHLTGYGEQEVLGRNCRFLQSPTGNVAKGEPRRFASPEAVSYMRKLLSSSKECQTTLINYRRGGQAFINLVTVIPLRGGVHNTPEEADEVAYHIGFQVNLTEQPTRILDKLRDGSFHSANSSWGTGNLASNGGLSGISHSIAQLAQAQNMTNIGLKGGKHGQMMSIAVSKELRNLFADPTFTDSVPISTGTNMSGPTGVSSASTDQGSNATTPLTMFVTPPSNTSMNRMSASGNTMAGSIPVSLSPSLSLLLLEYLPDFMLVLSLKGAFLYVAPSVRLVLGYEPQDLVGRGISDVCHPADLVPLMRELKEGSVSAGDVGSSTGAASHLLPKSVDLLFRALPKASALSPLRESQDTSAVQDDSRPSQSSSASTSASQSPSSSGTLCSNDPSDGTAPPYVWLECRGRLHVEPGKGRKAIILSGRARWMPVVRRGSIDKAGGIGNIQCQGEDIHGGSRMTAGVIIFPAC
jgi:PAS domain-containing protein